MGAYAVPATVDARWRQGQPGAAAAASGTVLAVHRAVGVPVVRDHYETLRAQAAGRRDGHGLPRFVERAFEDFLSCGCLAAGFARFLCAACRHERLVAFSCKGRGFCSSCGGRRMTERAAHLVEYVFPNVPVRQWELSLPPRVRYVLAWDHGLCRRRRGLNACGTRVVATTGPCPRGAR
ncbi:MAG: transposase zinc-binding domain-containing protein [Acidobacteria bacterium]|nr:transposase zinc-binding domain-containing protein [Acidobacteriota bacterium]